MNTIYDEWFSNIKNDLLAGLVVALSMIPGSIAFSIMAGVDPKVGMYTTLCITIVSAFTTGRPGMISTATGAMALVMITLVKEHGLQYLLAATILTGFLQMAAGLFRLTVLLRFISKAVITGFLNALAILIVLAQLPELIDVPFAVYPMVIAGLAIIYILPRFTKAIPSPLTAIVLLTGVSILFDVHIRTVADIGKLPDTFPVFLLPDIPLSLQTLQIILPPALTLAVIGLLEAMMTASIVDSLTNTDTNKPKECISQGISNIVTGFFGGMAGCAAIGQSVINIKSGGRTRLSSLASGVFFTGMILFSGEWVAKIPMAALVSVMIMVDIGTFDWASLRDARKNSASFTVIAFSTIVVVLATHNLAQGVLLGVLLSTFFFAYKVGNMLYVSGKIEDEGRVRHYRVFGQIFFASAEQFVHYFDFKEVIEKVIIDLKRAHFWDISAVHALDKVVITF